MPRKQQSLSDELIEAVEALKNKDDKKDRRTLFLHTKRYERFQKYCDKERLSASEVVDAMIARLLDLVD